MSALPVQSQVEEREPQPWRWTVDSYYAAWDANVFGADAQVELLEGAVYPKMSPQNSRHATAVRLATKALESVFGEGYDVRPQLPLRLDAESEPEPDVAVVRGSARDHVESHPQAADVILVVEASDSSIKIDRRLKQRVYARAQIQEFWIVNLTARHLEVFRGPTDETYASVQLLQPGENVLPLGSLKPVRVADLLP